MEDDAEAARITSAATLQLIVGLIGVLKAKGVISPEELASVFDGALFGVEQAPRSATIDAQRQLLERLARQLAALPSLLTGPESRSQEGNPEGT